MPPENNQSEIKRLMEKNATLLKENNELLKKIHRNAVWGFWIRFAWYAVLLGMPILLYFYVLEPYFTAVGSSYENFIDGLNELPGFRGVDQLLKSWNGN